MTLPLVPIVGMQRPQPPPYVDFGGVRAEKLGKGLLRGSDNSLLYYNPQAPLARGSYGRAFEGVTGDGSVVCVKEVALLPPKNRQDEKPGVSDAAAVQREIAAMERVDSVLTPSRTYVTARRTGNGALDNKVLMVMPLMDCLFDRLDSMPNNSVRGLMVYEMFEALAKELAHVHGKRVGHYDIKPENILFDGLTANDGKRRFVLADFGVSENLDVPKVYAGTLDYLSPEALHGYPMDEKADIWSLGVTVQCALTKLNPFSSPYKDGSATAFTKKRHKDWAKLFLGQRVRDERTREDFAEVFHYVQLLENANDKPWNELFNMMLNPDPQQRATAQDLVDFVAQHPLTPAQKAQSASAWRKQANLDRNQAARIEHLRERWARDLPTLQAFV